MRTDDIVREALADLAPIAPADTSALAGMHRAIHRRRRRQHVARIAAAVAVLALAVGAATAIALEAESDPADFRSDRTTSTPSTPDTAEGGPAGRTSFGPVTFQLPVGWEVVETRDEQSPLGGPTGRTMCVAPVDAGGNQVGLFWEGCTGLLIHEGDFLPGNEWEPYDPDAYWAWYHATDVASCPTDPDNTSGEGFDGVLAPDVPDGGLPVERGTHSVGERTAEYSRWEAVCQLSGFEFSPEAWYLPVSKVLVYDIFDHPETEAFLASFEFEE